MQNIEKNQLTKQFNRYPDIFCIKHEYNGKQSIQQLLEQLIIKRLKSRKMIP